MPIRVLERIGRKQFRLRKKALVPGGLNFCALVSIMGLVLEAILLLGEIVFVMMVTQLFFPSAFNYMRDNLESVEIFIFAAFCLNYILVESLYVCMGFGLYINSRVEVEGWDLQILFQKFAGPEARQNPLPRTGVTVLLLCFLFALSPAVHADPGPATWMEEESEGAEESKEAPEYFPEGFPFASEESLEDLEKILASPDFGGEEEGWDIRFRKRSTELQEMPDIDWISWLKKIRQAFGYMLRFFAVLVIMGFAGFARYWFLKNKRKGISRFRNGGKSYVNPLLSPESPQFLFARAEDFFRGGNLREAWAACLAGCIGACTRYRSLSFPSDATEYGCLELVRRALPAEAGGFDDLVRSWIFFAYGGRTPNQGAFEKALAYGRSLLTSAGLESL
jgi:hypothetical protein